MGALKDYYYNDCVPALKEEFGYTNINQAPRFTKVVVNVGLGEALQNAKALEKTSEDIIEQILETVDVP